MKNGHFVISLDFELLWGVRDKKTIEQYGENITGVHLVIPRLLDIFKKFNVNATFAIVGFLFFKTKAELTAGIPARIPKYINENLSPYNSYFNYVGENYTSDLYHFAPRLIELIQNHSEHEIGSHTFSHYYCLEEGQTPEDFEADIKTAIQIAKEKNLNIKSLIFPRNQFNEKYLQICNQLGITCYRGNEHSWLYKAVNSSKETTIRRALRLIDAYINISGHNCYKNEYLKSKTPVDIPSSRFLRPFNKKLKMLDHFRFNRIKSGMTYAAKNNLTYHLWWHPHNFGINQDENFSFLKKILIHYEYLNKNYGFTSITMAALANKIRNE